LREKVEMMWLTMPKPGRIRCRPPVAEEPEEVLEQHRVAAALRLKKVVPKLRSSAAW
jgi:hypothetical protein